MSELNYSKKQIQPLIDKYAINEKTNTTFARIINMFDGQPNYQLWGVKVVFSKVIKVDELEAIKDWVKINPTLIKKLTKNGNLICYSTPSDFDMLRTEMNGLCKIMFVKDMISKFNTLPRKLLDKEIEPDSFNGITCEQSEKFNKWFNLFNKFNKLSGSTKAKVIGRISAEKSVSRIEVLLNQALLDKYSWNKEDLLAFVSNNTPECDVIVNNDNIVVLNVKNYKDSNTLCYGRTSWCITSNENNWNQYVGDYKKTNKQYFLFDFSKAENDELAYIGFTTNTENGFRAAHSRSDCNMMNMGFDYHGKKVNIQKALSLAGLDLGTFLKLKGNTSFGWTEKGLAEFVSSKSNKNNYAIAFSKDGRVIVNVLSYDGLLKLIKHGYINSTNMPIDNKAKCYVLFDFNLKENDSKSVVVLYYKKDNYNIDCLNQCYDIYGTNIKDDKYLTSLGINTEDYLNREPVNPDILLHKLIDEGNEEEAINLIKKEKNIDVNNVFNDKTPIFSAIDAKMNKLVAFIITNDKFDSNVTDGFGESLIQALLYYYYCDITNQLTKDKEKGVKDMIETIIDSGKFDLNYINSNLDTVINIACTRPNMLWIVKKLAAKKDINVNVINDREDAALGNAIRFDNIEAIKVIGKRPDLKVTKHDTELAKKHNINLKDYIKPEPFNETTELNVGAVVTSEVEDVDKYNEIFKKVFAS